MHMWRLRMMAAAVLVLIVSGCTRSNRSNPLIGKWALADQSENNLACISLVEVEFTEKTITTGFGPTKTTVTVTYGQDGESYLATAGNGQAFRVKIESGGIEANGCHLVPVISGKSNPLLGKWKPVGQDPACRGLDKLEFTEDTMTMMLTEQARKEEQEPSGKLSFGVTYKRNGEFYVATSANGKGVFRFKPEISGIVMFDPQGGSQECHLFPAS